MLIGPGHPDWTELVVGLYCQHPLSLMSEGGDERWYFITLCRDTWYTQDILDYYYHYGSPWQHHDQEGCRICEAIYGSWR
jgi:hypothetical protein